MAADDENQYQSPEEKARAETLRKMQEQQERAAAEQEERLRSNDARNEYEKTKRVLDDHVKATKNSFEEMEKEHKRVGDALPEQERRQFEMEWNRAFEQWVGLASSALRQVMQKAMTRSIDSATVGQLSPGLGQLGTQFGSVLGGAIGSAFGPLGKVIGQAIGGPIVDMISMQAEGYNMLGARVARQAYGGGRGTGQDFERIGQDYRLMVNQVVRETGATAEAVGATFDALSKVNIGFEEGGKDLGQYALSVDRVLNLRPGRTLQMETDLVTKYGESAEQSKNITRDLIDAMAHFNVEQARTGSALMSTFAAGETLANTLEQIASAARSSGASLDSLNGMAIMLVQTMSASGAMRAGEVADSGGRVLAGLMPKSQSSPGAEAKRSGISRMMLNQTESGRALIARIEKEGDTFGMGKRERELMFETLASMHLSREGAGKEEGYNYLAATLGGISRMAGKGDNSDIKAWALLADRGNFGAKDMLMMRKLTAEFDKAGVFTAKDPASAMKQMMDAKSADPEYAATVKNLQKVMDEAKRQGEAQASTLDKIADHMVKMSVWFNKSYWTHGRDAIADAFGLAPKSSMLDILGGVMGYGRAPARGSTVGGGMAPGSQMGSVPGMNKTDDGQRSSMTRQEMMVSPDTMTRAGNESTANRSGLEPTGSN